MRPILGWIQHGKEPILIHWTELAPFSSPIGLVSSGQSCQDRDAWPPVDSRCAAGRPGRPDTAAPTPVPRSPAGSGCSLVDGRLVDRRPAAQRAGTGGAARVSRSTVAAAYADCAKPGCLEARPGSGNFIRAAPRIWPAGISRGRPGGRGCDHHDLQRRPAPPGGRAAYAQAVAALPQLLSGHGYFPDGLPALRERLADRYTARGLPTEPAQMIVTSGALAAINLVAHTALDPGDRVLVESPSYPNALESFRRHSARLVPAPMTEDRLGSGRTRGALRQSAPRMAYLIPDFHNPTGALLGAADRRQLGSALRRERCIPLVDETLVEVSLDGRRCRRRSPPAARTRSPSARRARRSGAVCGSAGSGLPGRWSGRWSRAGPVSTVAAPVEQLVLAELLDRAEPILDEQRVRLREQRDALMVLLGRAAAGLAGPAAAGGSDRVGRVAGAASSSQLAMAAAAAEG